MLFCCCSMGQCTWLKGDKGSLMKTLVNQKRIGTGRNGGGASSGRPPPNFYSSNRLTTDADSDSVGALVGLGLLVLLILPVLCAYATWITHKLTEQERGARFWASIPSWHGMGGRYLPGLGLSGVV